MAKTMSKFVKKAEEAKKQLAMAEKELMKAQRLHEMTVAKTTKAVEAARAKLNKSLENYSIAEAEMDSNLDMVFAILNC